jgi:hypothetical protein
VLKTEHKCSSVHSTRTTRYLQRERRRRRLVAGSSVAATNRYRTMRIMQNYTEQCRQCTHTVCALITCVTCATCVCGGRRQCGGCGTSRIVSNLISSHSCMPFITSHRLGSGMCEALPACLINKVTNWIATSFCHWAAPMHTHLPYAPDVHTSRPVCTLHCNTHIHPHPIHPPSTELYS